MMTIQKISFAVLLLAMFVAGAFSATNTASAQVTGGGGIGCSDCGGGGTTGGGDVTGGGGTNGGGGDTPATPVCTITVNKTEVNFGETYTVSWNGTPAGALFYINGQRVANRDSANYTFDSANYERFVMRGDNGGPVCEAEVRVNRRVTAAPVCNSFTATPGSLPVGGGSVNLVWDTTNATNATLDGQAVAGDGTLSVNVTANKTFTLNLTNSVGQKSCTAPVTVAVPTPLPICDSFTSNLSSIVRGNSATLTWATTNADAVSITNVSGPFTVDGSKVVTPNITTTYTLTATKGANSVTCAVPVTVTDVPTPLDPICNSFTVNPTTINRGQSTTLTWATTNATTVNINNAVGNVLVDGSVPVSPLVTTTYTLTATKDAKSVTCAVPVTVIQPENPTVITCAANVTNFSANSSSIRRGESSTLTWNTTGLTNVRFDNLNATGLSGSVTVSPSDSITYTLIGTKGSQTINCPVTVSVSTSNGGGGGGGGSSSPTCKLTISDKNISLGERVTIKWDTSRATEVSLKDNHGKTLIDTDGKSSSAKKDLYDGEITIRPEKDTTYTLLAEKGSKDRTCKVSVDVEDTIVVTQVRDQQPLVTGIALTQVPYTGFEAGPFMTSVFYTLLAAWALYMAYVLVGRRNGMNASAFTPATVTADIVPSTVMYPTAVTSAPVFYQAPVAAVASTATVGYDAHVDATTAIEAQAHAAHVLLSSDATAYFIAATAGEDREVILSGVLAAAKASYPSEDGWVVVSADRMVELASKY